ncbi:hypothetical protein IU486_31215 [Streptomyces gardneri]|uniref:hypothetical protein n=1 Tax=Nocardia abscessus TaxID=120957 RepID=UPI0018932199|nr:hypothetical protein [Nocardia abscessus]MBF6169173.1 hypothetical protein [Streptomyces gardneri]MBF6475257.1 hypothetical protein [Nocardia abscessus]
MELLPTTRYPSRGLGATNDTGAPVSVDGLEVVDEQVVMLSPLERPGQRRRHRAKGDVGHAVG